MRLADTMKSSTEVMQQINELNKIPDVHEAVSQLGKEMMKAGLIEELIEEGMDGIDGPELEEEAEEEVEHLLDELAIDASVKLAVIRPEGAAASASATPAEAAP